MTRSLWPALGNVTLVLVPELCEYFVRIRVVFSDQSRPTTDTVAKKMGLHCTPPTTNSDILIYGACFHATNVSSFILLCVTCPDSSVIGITCSQSFRYTVCGVCELPACQNDKIYTDTLIFRTHNMGGFVVWAVRLLLTMDRMAHDLGLVCVVCWRVKDNQTAPFPCFIPFYLLVLCVCPPFVIMMDSKCNFAC